MLYEFEFHHPKYWTGDNIFQCVQKALKRLRGFLDNRELPHYFLPEVNLIKSLNHNEVADIIVDDIDEFLRNPEEALRKLNNKGRSRYKGNSI